MASGNFSHCKNKNYLIYIVLLLLFINAPLYRPATNDSIKEKMNSNIEETKLKWRYNPFRYETYKRIYGWLDPDAYISRYWMGDIFNIEEMYPNPAYRFDKMQFYHQPTLATEINPIDFLYKGVHRFRIGVGFLTHLFMAIYKSDYQIYYGESLFFGTYMQTELYFDYIYNDTLRFRFTPVRHICSHIGGDILGDSQLYDRNTEEFRDSSIEQMHFSLHYNYGYFTFYGGFSFAMSGFKESNFVNLFKMFYGTDFRYPIWGEISFIAGIYLAADYDRINTVNRIVDFREYEILDTLDKFYPCIAVGIGFEIYRFTVGMKYEFNRSRHLYAYRKMESKLGFEATLFF